MFLSQGLLTWTLLLSVLAGSVSSLQTVNGAEGGSVNLTVSLTLPPLENRLAIWTSAVNGTIVTALGNSITFSAAFRGRCELLPDLTLRLNNLTLADQGDYSLTVSNTAGGAPVTVTFRLAVYSSVSSLQTVNGAEGGSVNLTVSLTLPPLENRLAIWTSAVNGAMVTALGNSITYAAPCQGRCELFPDLTLRLDNLTLADQGDYSLTVSNTAGGAPTTVTVRLAVYKPFDKMPTLNASESFPANGSNVNLTCNAPDQTVENYTFYRNQVNACSQDRVTCTGSNLTFHPIIESDEGNYTCTIQNPINNKTSEPYLLKVEVPVHEVMIGSNASSLLWVGKDSVSLNCSALGTDVQFSWNLNGAALPSDPRYKVTHDSLIISPVERNDNASFTCIARNRVNNITSKALTLSLACE
ncbi:pregnancy-specific beta-1-glycoprotein 8-like [Pelobates fuscus]|uniref:pregnancy-specific beta-1-glycoprotein 8-like n=1 Tax=Pelobates fuscus TaxID=191477 RepID=UPI002FE49A55